ncbi:hypothetical protein B6D87_02155 [Pseudomonas fragi]|uniref:hypothetical protein n=1 Tax=Pseudomonas fragi TaxID=296 RepID=UPI000A2A3DB4|nr:hypothetical protein [Pseudomonas fragi]ARQ73088.1 hypothetical protein B6D87_02155 [Pseudomonas fragi]
MHRKKARKYRKLIKSFSNEQLATFNIVGDYVADQRKLKILENLPKEDQESLFCTISCITFASEYDVDKLNSDETYKKVYSLLKESESCGAINPELKEIYETQRNHAKNYLHIKKGRIIKSILSNTSSNYKKLKKIDPDKANHILSRCISRATDKQQEELKTLDDILLHHEYSPIVLRLTPALLTAKLSGIDSFSLAAALITKPKLQFLQLMHLDESWDKFPLKWYVNHLPTTVGRALLEEFKDGNDLSGIFTANYIDGKFRKLEELLSNQYIQPPLSHILCSRANIINDVINCFNNRIYSATICTALTVIEGMLWDFSKEYNHFADKKIYSNADHEELILISDKKVTNFTIGTLLTQTSLCDFFDENFIKYFCDELYSERNPILHGRDTEAFTMENSAKKIATIEYILHSIQDYNKKSAMRRLEKSLPSELKDRIHEIALTVIPSRANEPAPEGKST